MKLAGLARVKGGPLDYAEGGVEVGHHWRGAPIEKEKCCLVGFRFDGKLLEVGGVGGFAFVQGHDQLAIGTRVNATKNAVHVGQAGSAKQIVALQGVQVLDGLSSPAFNSAMA
ncbi:MAG: hypothetical protein LAO78_22415 [Acidobacteriia bacterium]|nr:hypothetical protein [Terriglobia bacterium]